MLSTIIKIELFNCKFFLIFKCKIFCLGESTIKNDTELFCDNKI